MNASLLRRVAFLAASAWLVLTVQQGCGENRNRSRGLSRFSWRSRENGTVPLGPEGDRHIFRPETGRKMSQSPPRERLPLISGQASARWAYPSRYRPQDRATPGIEHPKSDESDELDDAGNRPIEWT